MAQVMLDLERYFEQDIIEFLTKQKELEEKEEKHSVSEMLSALEANNIALATKIIENAVENYNKISIDNIYKEIHFKKIIEMYRQAQEFLKIHPQRNSLKDAIDMLSNSGQLELGPVEKITAFEEKINKLEDDRIKAMEQEREFALVLDENIRKVNELIAISLRKKDLKTSIKYYKELREFFEQYPSTVFDKKQEIYNDLLSFFMQIKKLREELTNEQAQAISDRNKLEKTKNLGTNKYLRLENIRAIISEIKSDVKDSDFTDATLKIITLREMTNRIPDEYKHIRSILNSKIDIITQRVEFVKRVKNHNSEREI